MIITSNLPFDEWTEIFGSERLTGALLDRLTHHVHILGNERRELSPQTEPKTAEFPKNPGRPEAAETVVAPAGPQGPPTLLRSA